MSAQAWETAIAVVRSCGDVIILSLGIKVVFHFVGFALRGGRW